eukprot:gene24678-10308_t
MKVLHYPVVCSIHGKHRFFKLQEIKASGFRNSSLQASGTPGSKPPPGKPKA